MSGGGLLLCRHGIAFNQAPTAAPAATPGPQLGTAVQQPLPQEPAAQLLEGELEGAFGDGEVQVCRIDLKGDGKVSASGGHAHVSHDINYYIRKSHTRFCIPDYEEAVSMLHDSLRTEAKL